ncbi:MAG: DUF167 domain-containing protein [Candidatus Helarchaeota archaeon]
MTKTIKVHVIPGSKETKIVQISHDYFEIKLKAPPIKGKANKELIKVLSEFFNIKKSAINIIKGELSQNKIIRIYQENKIE